MFAFYVFPNPRRVSGYSLIEIVTVCMIISLIASVAMPMARNFHSSTKLAAQASVLVGDIRWARSNAIVTQAYTRLLFSSDYSSWVVQVLSNTTSGNPIVGEPTAGDTTGYLTYSTTLANWKNILDDDETHSFEFDTTITMTPNAAPAIFFRSDGVLVLAPSGTASPIGLTTVKLTVGAMDHQVEITPGGAIESMEYYNSEY